MVGTVYIPNPTVMTISMVKSSMKLQPSDPLLIFAGQRNLQYLRQRRLYRQFYPQQPRSPAWK